MQQLIKQPSARRLRMSTIVMALMIAFMVASVSILSATADDKARTLATLTGDHQKQQFVAGKRVEVANANVVDDIFAAGQDLTFETVSATTIIAAGMSLSFKGITANDLMLAGGQMDLSGNVKDDVVVAVCPVCPFGGRLHLTDAMQIGDDARLAGRDVTVDGRIGGDLYVAARHFKLSGEIAGNVKVEAERIVLAPSARIGGDLLYAGPTKPEMPDGAVVAGQIRQVQTDIPFAERLQKRWIWYSVLTVLGILLALVLLGATAQLATPGLLSSAAAMAVERPWVSLGRGLVLAVLAPAAIALLMATVIGIPIGLIIIAAYFVLLAVAFVTISYCIGLYVRGLFGKKGVPPGLGSKVLWTNTGTLILVIVGLVPFIGWAIGVLAIIAGLGAAISQLGPIFRQTDAMRATT